MNFTKLKNYLDKLVTEGNTPCVDCMVYKNHEPVFRYYKGVRDLNSCTPTNGDEIYFLFSMTKVITCAAALQLYEKGLYTLDDPLSKYMPEFSHMKIASNVLDTDSSDLVARGSSMGDDVKNIQGGFAKIPITIRDLFTMSSGLDYNLGAEGIRQAIQNGSTSTRALTSALSETILGFEPGTRFRYSLSHDVLGALIEIRSGQSFGEYLKKHIFEPLGMKNTFFGPPEDPMRLAKIPVIYRFSEDRIPEKTSQDFVYRLSSDYESGGAGLCSCAEDYALFMDAMACGGIGKSGNRILSAATVELMRTNHLTGKQSEDFDLMRPGYGYGLGVRVHINKAKSGSPTPLGEFGWDGAAGAYALADPENLLSLTHLQHTYNTGYIHQAGLKNALYACLDEYK